MFEHDVGTLIRRIKRSWKLFVHPELDVERVAMESCGDCNDCRAGKKSCDRVPTFDPRLKHRWIFIVKGIDSFVVRDFKFPTIDDRLKNNEFSITIYDVVGTKTTRDTIDWMSRLGSDTRSASFKFIDRCGALDECWEFSNVRPISIKPSDVSYEDDDVRTISITFTYERMTITYVDEIGKMSVKNG